MEPSDPFFPVWTIILAVGGFLILFPAIWCSVSWLISRISGWYRLLYLWVLIFILSCGGTPGREIAVPGKHKTIQEAVDSAEPGDRIVVQNGRYLEQIKLRRGIHLISAGSDAKGKTGLLRAEKTVIEFAGSPVISMAKDSSLDGFTITGAAGGFDPELFARHRAERGENLPDSHGAVGFEDSQPAITIDGATARVTHCIVRDNGQAGFGITGENNRSVISQNVVFRNMGGGIGIANGASPTVSGNRCSENLRGGIGCRNSFPLIRENHCFNNVRAGIGIREGATPRVEGNHCYNNRRAGIGVRMPGTSPRIHGNHCYRNGMAGIGCRNEAAPWIINNDCYENRLAGIGAMANARPVIIGNRIRDNEAAAIGLDNCETGEAVIRGNRIEAKSLVALGIQGGWRVVVTENHLSRKGGLPPLVMVFKGAKAEFEKNTFVGSGVAAIRTQGQVFVSDNTFQCDQPRKGGPPQWAVWALPGSNASVTDDNRISGWKVAEIPAIKVANREQLARAMETAKPGNTILIAPGHYEGGLSGTLRGAEGKPIVMAAMDVKNPPVFKGRSYGFHLKDSAFVELRNLVVQGTSGNGINIDDGGSYDTPAHQITLSGLQIRDVGPKGNLDGIKLSGVDDFRIGNCIIERWGDRGSGIDMVGCHRGLIRGCRLVHQLEIYGSGIQAKGGSREITIQSCHFEEAGGRAINIGGSTGLDYFRPRDAPFEAADITVTDCRFLGSDAPIAFVGVDGATVRNNLIQSPKRWVLRILQESRDPRFVPCRNGVFGFNLIKFSSTIRDVANIGPSTNPGTFRFPGNAWINEDAPGESKRYIKLPVEEIGGVHGVASPFAGPRDP